MSTDGRRIKRKLRGEVSKNTLCFDILVVNFLLYVPPGLKFRESALCPQSVLYDTNKQRHLPVQLDSLLVTLAWCVATPLTVSARRYHAYRMFSGVRVAACRRRRRRLSCLYRKPCTV